MRIYESIKVSNAALSKFMLYLSLSTVLVLILFSHATPQITLKYEMNIPTELGVCNDYAVDDEGNVFLSGYYVQTYKLFKVNTDGELAWHKDLPILANKQVIDVVVGHDGSPVVAYSDYETVETMVIKYDSDGNTVWGPLIIPQGTSCGVALAADMVIDDDGYVYIIATGSLTGNFWECSRVHVISPSGSLNTCQLDNIKINHIIATSSSAFVLGQDSTGVHCENPEWYNSEKRMVLAKIEQTGSCAITFGPWDDHLCDINQCEYGVTAETAARLSRQGNPYGNIAVPISIREACAGNLEWRYYIAWFNTSGTQVDMFEIEGYTGMCVDHNDNIYLSLERGYTNYIDKLSPEGNLLWEIPQSSMSLFISVFDVDNYLYSPVQPSSSPNRTNIRCLNPDDGSTEWECPINSFGQPTYVRGIHIDDEKRIYVHHDYPMLYPNAVSVYEMSKKIAILDGSQDNNPIANTEFWLIRMHNDIPVLTEDTLGKFTSDENGEFELNIIDCGEFEFVHDLYNGSTSDILSVGDTLKIAKYVASRDAVKHADLLATMFNIHLDNAIFKIGGEMIFDTLDNMAEQEIILDHSEFRYNLVVSVEWDASVSYLTILEENMKYMSNFLYDITDGQVRLDTIRIFDDMEHWDVADVRIKADNMVWPHCRNDVAGINYPSAGGSGREIIMPRKWFGNQDESRNNTEVTNLFYSLVNQDYRTKAHEFGHYVLGFYDEYMFWDDDQDKYRKGDDLRCPSMQGGNYGTMDHHYLSGEPFASEISSRYRYIDPECRNTEQYRRHDKSCWDHFETWVEAFSWGPDNIYVPLLKPDLDDEDERHDIGTDYLFIGPNNDPEDLDYDAGSKIIFTETPSAPNPDFGNIHIRVALFWGGDKADVFLTNSPFDPSEIRYINQGQTADNAQMLVLGAKTSGNDHLIQAFKSGTQGTVIPIPKALSVSASGSYACGLATAGKSGVSKVGNYYHSPSFDTDTLIIELRTIEGEFPAISDILLSGDQAEYRLQCPGLFPSEPSLDLITDYGHQNTYTLDLNGSAYVKLLTDSLGDEGYFMIWAEDDSAGAFFFINEYVLTCPDFDDPEVRISGAGGQSELLVDSINNSIEKIIIVSSSYPVPLDGFTEGEVVKAGKTHTVSCYPNVTLAGDNQIFIHYFDSDLQIDSNTTADELSLAIYKWNVNDAVWDYMGGSVDTSLNYVTEKITNAGVYAAFTTDIITGVEDDEDDGILPYRFELSQNYPNPFNPVTTIDYNLPRRSHVTIEVYNVLGQKVQTLVDREESAGSYTITWDGTTANGQPAATGVYLYRFQAGDHIETKKMILLK